MHCLGLGEIEAAIQEGSKGEFSGPRQARTGLEARREHALGCLRACAEVVSDGGGDLGRVGAASDLIRALIDARVDGWLCGLALPAEVAPWVGNGALTTGPPWQWSSTTSSQV